MAWPLQLFSITCHFKEHFKHNERGMLSTEHLMKPWRQLSFKRWWIKYCIGATRVWSFSFHLKTMLQYKAVKHAKMFISFYWAICFTFVFLPFIISHCCCIVEKERACKPFVGRCIYQVYPVQLTKHETWNWNTKGNRVTLRQVWIKADLFKNTLSALCTHSSKITHFFNTIFLL